MKKQDYKIYLVGLSNASEWRGRRDNVTVFDSLEEAKEWAEKSYIQGYPVVIWEAKMKPISIKI